MKTQTCMKCKRKGKQERKTKTKLGTNKTYNTKQK